MMLKAGLWMVLVACGAAYESFDNPRSVVEMDDDNNFNYNEPYYPDLQQLEMEYVKDLMMHKLFNPAMHTDGLTMRYGPQNSFIAPETRFINLPNAELLNLKDSVVKRNNPSTTSTQSQQTAGNSMTPNVQKQPKWKAKKGRRVGSQVVCYFKLCAFRPPV